MEKLDLISVDFFPHNLCYPSRLSSSSHPSAYTYEFFYNSNPPSEIERERENGHTTKVYILMK